MSNKYSNNVIENSPKERQYIMTWGPEVTAHHLITKKLAFKGKPNESIKSLFAGATKIIVKADIIDGVFTVQKRVK